MDERMSIGKRIEILTKRLQARTNHEGDPLPGYKQNVASIRAELAQLQEQMEATTDGD